VQSLQFIIDRVQDTVKIKRFSVNKALVESGAGKDFIANMRKGQTPSPKMFSDLAFYLDVSVDYLLGRTDNPDVNK
jgi:hypothetical protein